MTQLTPETAASAAAAQACLPAAVPDGRGTRRRLRRNRAAVVAAVAAVLAARAAGAGPTPMWWVEATLAVVTSVYLAAFVFKLVVIFCGSMAAARAGRETQPGTQNQSSGQDSMPDDALPLYSVLVPLVTAAGTDRAAESSTLSALSALDYPAERLQVLLLIPEDHPQPSALPANFEVVAVPMATVARSARATRPAACAAGLARARGELCAVYEPGQHPEPGQLREAAGAFSRLPAWVVCVRSEARCDNPDTNWLTQCVAADKAVSSVLFTHGLDRLRLPVPLGASACHFRTQALRQLGPWEPGDRTHGADIGVRIARRGWSTRMISSVTSEEPDRRLGQWLRGRGNGITDDYLTWLAHIRTPLRLWRDLGPARFASLQLTLALSVLVSLANPLLWALTLAALTAGPGQVGRIFPASELYMVIAVLLAGNLVAAYSLMVGCMEHGLFPAVRTMLLAPVYWALTSLAACGALFRALRPAFARRTVFSVSAS